MESYFSKSSLTQDHSCHFISGILLIFTFEQRPEAYNNEKLLVTSYKLIWNHQTIGRDFVCNLGVACVSEVGYLQRFNPEVTVMEMNEHTHTHCTRTHTKTLWLSDETAESYVPFLYNTLMMGTVHHLPPD